MAWPSSGWETVAVSDDDAPACVEHVWTMTGMTVAADGTHIEHQCVRCGATTVEGPGQLRGEVG